MFNLKKLLMGCFAVMLVIALCTGFTYAAEYKTGVITGNRVNIRETASTDAKVLTTLEKGEKVSVISSSGDWSKVKYNSTTGWIFTGLMSVDGASSAASSKGTTSTGTVTAETLNVRAEGSLSADVLCKLSKGEKVTILSTSGDWFKIKTSNGTQGWVSSEYVSKGAASTSRGGEVLRTQEAVSQKGATKAQQIVSTAKKYIGVKYVYGGSSPKQGFDCSGFVKYVYSQNGISLTRSSSEQAAQGKKISKSDLKAGDLVFFDTNGGRNNINHVGIYVGDGKFIHASSPKYDVTITSLSDAYYAKSYMTARRIIS